MTKSYTFPRTHRIAGKDHFARVFDARVRESRGPVTLYAIPNDFGHPRLGISMSRKVGTAARRNRIKRMLRESFRLHQHDLPAAYDFVVTLRPHEPLILAEYQKLLTHLMLKLHATWTRRKTPLPRPQPDANDATAP